MLSEINEKLGTDFHYLAEIDAYNIKGSGIIMKSFAFTFSNDIFARFRVIFVAKAAEKRYNKSVCACRKAEPAKRNCKREPQSRNGRTAADTVFSF